METLEGWTLTHAHITSWLITIVLFLIAVSMARRGAGKAKVVQMVLRLFYLITLATGLMLLHGITTISPLYWLKALAGLWVIGAMEMVLAAEKRKTHGGRMDAMDRCARGHAVFRVDAAARF